MTGLEFFNTVGRAFSSIMNVDQFNKFKSMCLNLSEEEVESVIKTAYKKCAEDGFDPEKTSSKEMLDLMAELRTGLGNTSDDLALNTLDAEFLDDEKERQSLLSKINKSVFSDTFIFKEEESEKYLMSLYDDQYNSSNNTGVITISSDLLISDTIPLMDICIKSRLNPETSGFSGVATSRVVIFDDYKEIMATHDGGYVGAIMQYSSFDGVINNDFLGVPIYGKKEENLLGFGPVFFSGNITCTEFKRKLDEGGYELKEITVSNVVKDVITVWYGIQISLLHPIINTVIGKAKMTVLPTDVSTHKKNKKPPKKRYIKEHIVSGHRVREELERHYTSGREFHRHTLVWYVMGHWRTYKDGTKIFIKGYWKGALRDVKKNIDDRERTFDID